MEHDGSIQNGFSYKFNTHLGVTDKHGDPGVGEITKYDTACL